MVPEDAELFEGGGLFDDAAIPDDIRKEGSTREWAAGARYTYWVGVVLLGSFLTGLINAAPPRLADPTWQLNVIGLLLGSGGMALIGSLLLCLARVFNQSDRQIQNRALLVRKLATWVALGWLLLIPLQLFLGVRLINSQGSSELEQAHGLTLPIHGFPLFENALWAESGLSRAAPILEAVGEAVGEGRSSDRGAKARRRHRWWHHGALRCARARRARVQRRRRGEGNT